MPASTFGQARRAFAHSGDNFYVFTHKSGQVFRPAHTPAGRKHTRPFAMVRDANGYSVPQYGRVYARKVASGPVVKTVKTVRMAPTRSAFVPRPRMTLADMPAVAGVWADK